MAEGINVDQKTVESILMLFYIHKNKRTQTQGCDMVDDFNAFLSFYPDLQTYKFPNGETIPQRLSKIRNRPVAFFVEHNPNALSKNELKYIDDEFALPELDYLYFRDTAFINPLKKTYTATFRQRTRYYKRLMLSQLLKTMQFVRQELYAYMVFFTSQKKVPFDYMPAFTNYDKGKNEDGFWNA